MRAVRGSWFGFAVVPALALGVLTACGSSGQPGSPSSGGAGGNASGGLASGGQNLAGSSAQSGSSSGGSSGGVTQGGDGNVAGHAGTGTSGAGGQAGPMFPALIQDCDVPAAHANADAALEATLVSFWNGPQRYLNAASPTTGNLTGYWTYAQFFDALLDGVERTGGQRYQGLVLLFYDGRDKRGWIVDYFDDQAWMTLALMRAFDLTGEQLYLDQAKTIYENTMLGWDTTCCGNYKGGIWWDRKHGQKATASNATNAIAGVRLAKRSGDTKYLDFAKQVYGFWFTNMVNPQNYAIFDHLSPDGTRALGGLTYNHGVMIGAALELHAATGEAHYLDEAHKFGHYLATNSTKTSPVGPLLADGNSCEGDCAAWKGIGYRYLAQLFRQDPSKTEYQTVLAAGAVGVWTLARNPDNNFFASNWAGPAPTVGGIEKQGSATMALNLYAMLCGSDPNAAAPPKGRYEAEEATNELVAIEAQYAGFSGFGYASNFMAKPQSVTFDVAAPAGNYRVDWRYAATPGTAVRTVLVDGKLVTPSQSFAATPGWDQWAVSSTSVSLNGGKTTIQLLYDNSSSGPLALDRIDLIAQ